MQDQPKLTPLMQQYFQVKDQFPDTLIFFQVGDFYELFFEDARTAATFLGITLTTRGKHLDEAIPLCGVPVHTKDHYIAKLVKGGFKVALCDQLTEPQPGKIVTRGITQVLTPGTLAETQLLDEKSASYLLSFFPMQQAWGVLFGELLTSQLFATTMPAENFKALDAELVRFFPDEILVPDTALAKPFRSYFSSNGFYTTVVPHQQGFDTHEQAWLAKVQAGSQKRIDSVDNALRSFYQYIKRNQETALSEFSTVHFYKPEDFMGLDAATQRHLELVKNNQDGSRANTLFSLLDKAATPMGSRTIKKWLVRPLMKQEAIVKRQDVVEYVSKHASYTQQLYQVLRAIGDLERVVGRIAIKRGSQQDYIQLSQALRQLRALRSVMSSSSVPAIMAACAQACSGFDHLTDLLSAGLNEDYEKAWIIKQGFDQKLDECRTLIADAQQLMAALEHQEQERTGINSLKIRYNALHGYYVEITKTNAHLVPPDYTRYQTLVGKERYTMPALKEIESKIIAAQESVNAVEQEIFARLKQEVELGVPALRKAAHALATLDALVGFGLVAYNNGYVRPQFTDDRTYAVRHGRHPVVEQNVGSRFIPNDCVLNDEQSLWIITGPNMGGKSTFLRQTALISVMAQCGLFVPAAAAQLPIFDAIFTRIGASDNVAEGKSTFLVEMEETAHICSNATKDSLLILDEVGRGTSTFDGLAVAQAVVEYIHTHVQARCLFATHYHELTALQETFPGISSYYAASKKTNNGILLLYTILRGVADGSFGLEVAKLARIPHAVVERAYQVIATLGHSTVPSHAQPDVIVLQQELAAYKYRIEKIETMFATLDVDNMTPRQALDVLWSLKNKQDMNF